MSRNKIQNHNLKFKILSLILLFYLLPTTYYLLPACYTQQEFIYDSKDKRDPFIPLVTPDGRLLKLEPEEGAAELSLEGIIYDKNGLSYAVVNGEVVRIGEMVSGYQVLKIEDRKVVFIKEGQPQEIELKKEE